ncbi:hypothetical protein JK621_11320 [Serratia plymuthica]|nr:hypothetical protein [Serratia plymuthica]QUY50692.1 hypothetical protein JK621_11320 [Serratia plymuthica]
MTRYVWNNRLKQRIRFSYWNELCVTGCAGRALLPVIGAGKSPPAYRKAN